MLILNLSTTDKLHRECFAFSVDCCGSPLVTDAWSAIAHELDEFGAAARFFCSPAPPPASPSSSNLAIRPRHDPVTGERADVLAGQ